VAISRAKDLTKHNPFGRLTAIKRVPKPEGLKGREAYWLCSCSCGNPELIVVRRSSLCSGNTTSCGCVVKEHNWKCRNDKFLEIGVNDLKTLHPEIANEAYGWNPSEYLPGSQQKKAWRCKKSHPVWEISIDNRVRSKTKCPYCAGKLPIVGENDLKTLHPKIAAQADGWDPTKFTAKSDKELPWLCDLGHSYPQRISGRTYKEYGCPYCSGNKPLLGFNTLFDKFPKVAEEAFGWDPKKYTYGSRSRKSWKCKKNHPIWHSCIYVRTTKRPEGADQSGCPYCAGKLPIVGETDLQTLFPKIAAEADGWDPTKFVPGSHEAKNWKCQECGYKWGPVLIKSRTSDETKCPICADRGGYRRDEKGWLYLMIREDEQQIGITNQLKKRYEYHKQRGWKPQDKAIGPFDGDLIYKMERKIKDWLKENVGTINGTTENWETSKFKVATLKTLFKKVGLELPKNKNQ
tara:strand:+ start:159 stop:1541 length:1383 start_codon:yes stop_codon:yes gene_type:complete